MVQKFNVLKKLLGKGDGNRRNKADRKKDKQKKKDDKDDTFEFEAD